ncbi:deoxyribonuclease gamma-like isoform X2 [Ciona intestinalis]
MRLILLLTLCSMKVESLDELVISAFNIKVFGQSKISKPEVVDVIIKILSRYDLVIVQEIRDIQETAFPTLVEQLNEGGGVNYTWFTGPRVGRTSSKEQYGFVYRPDKLELLAKFQYNDTDDVFEREPIITRFRWLGGGGREFTLIPMHAKPTDAVAEMNGLLQVYMDAVDVYGNNTIILGDLNADCSYVCQSCWDSVGLRTDPTFHWLVGDDVDTTVSNTDCAYDRIIVAGSDLIDLACDGDTYRFDVALNLTQDQALDVSDHYPVEFRLLSNSSYKNVQSDVTTTPTIPTNHIRISAFNIKVFGQSKISKPEVVDVIIKILSRYDLVIVQEIRDIQETAFPTLVEQLNEGGGVNYTWFTGPRVGRTSSKEQYGFVYRPDKLELLAKFQYNDTDDVFEREPIITRFRWLGGGGREFTLIPMHAKPTDAVAEMNGLLQVYMDAVDVYGNNTIILGDLNADCSYVCQSCWDSVGLRTDPTFHWLVGDDVDTTVSNTDCAYDRIIVTGDLINDVCCADVYRFDLGLNLTADEPWLAITTRLKL